MADPIDHIHTNQPRARAQDRPLLPGRISPVASVLLVALLTMNITVVGCGQGGDQAGGGNAGATVTVASKDFPEQFILAEIMAQLVEAETDLQVQRTLTLGGTMVCHHALVNGDIDFYAEYTGTALVAILDHEVIADPPRAHEFVDTQYREQFDCRWLEPFGFKNTYTLTVREEDARENGWETISDLVADAENLRAGFTHEFVGRPDGLPGLKEAYDLEFRSVQSLAATLMYKAIADGQVDVICAFATDGRIAAYDLQMLEDDRSFFPPYDAAPVVRNQTVQAHPELLEALNLLAGRIDETTMQSLNFQVDEHQRDPADVAEQFLRESGLVGDASGAQQPVE